MTREQAGRAAALIRRLSPAPAKYITVQPVNPFGDGPEYRVNIMAVVHITTLDDMLLALEYLTGLEAVVS